ncbi:hypothetical protein DPMN_146659 [Dreissena polymorpha]|uniref:Uncharacterized protein n=1 Tax=Dreissena polymorpha TaxID=45954 RepID=A0A9D4F8B2_DREPO|nr:hypothetical protein DPMN_146659 [Dreissena polymorpha]
MSLNKYTGSTVVFQWCMRGQSVAMNTSLQTDPIPGGWSPWVSATCSRTCGGGVLMQTRTCTDPK